MIGTSKYKHLAILSYHTWYVSISKINVSITTAKLFTSADNHYVKYGFNKKCNKACENQQMNM